MRRVRTCSTRGSRPIGFGLPLGFFPTILDQLRRQVGSGCEVAEQPAPRSRNVSSCAHLERLALLVEVQRQKISLLHAHAPADFGRDDESSTFTQVDREALVGHRQSVAHSGQSRKSLPPFSAEASTEPTSAFS